MEGVGRLEGGQREKSAQNQTTRLTASLVRRMRGQELGGEPGKFLLETFPCGSAVQDFSGYVVDAVRNQTALCLGDFAEALVLGEAAADNTVVALIASIRHQETEQQKQA